MAFSGAAISQSDSWSYCNHLGTNLKLEQEEGWQIEKAQIFKDIIELLNQSAPKPISPLDIHVRKNNLKLEFLLDASKTIVTEAATWRVGGGGEGETAEGAFSSC